MPPVDPLLSARHGPSQPFASNPEKRRSRSGCLTCRQRRIKCDEVHPTCGRCLERGAECEWPVPGTLPRKVRRQRPISSCDGCRHRRTKCGATPGTTCEACSARSAECVWTPVNSSLPPIGSTSGDEDYMDTLSNTDPIQINDLLNTSIASTSQLPLTSYQPSTISAPPTLSNPLPTTQIPQSDLRDLARLYFTTIHYFGYTAFIHEGDYWERYENGSVPEDLTLLMAAHALRFGGKPVAPQQLEQADVWVSQVGDRLIAQVMREFGVIELMGLVLCQIYDFLNGRYSRGFVMAGMAIRMMTFLRLHVLDESIRPTSKPLLRTEGLRRLAWSIWFLDATIDGGNSGFSAIRDGALTIQLPCDERSFLLGHTITTEPLVPGDAILPPGTLGLGSHLIRAMAARQELAEIHSLLARRLIDTPIIEHKVRLTIIRANRLLDSLDQGMTYSRFQYLAYKDQLPLLVSLHVMRNTCRRHIALLEILASANITRGIGNIPIRRQTLIDGALELSEILKDALANRVVLDPQIAMHAYNGIETLLFQPLRQMMDKTKVGVTREAVIEAMGPFVRVIRDLAGVTELVNLIYPEAINRMVQFGYVDGLTEADIMAVLKKVHCLANAEAEFDFQESFWRYELSLNRKHAAANPAQIEGESPNNTLLEIPSSASPSYAAPPPPPTANTHPPLPTKPIDSITRLQTFLANSKSGYNTPAIFGGASPGPSQPPILPNFTFDDIETLLNGALPNTAGAENNGAIGPEEGLGTDSVGHVEGSQVMMMGDGNPAMQMPFPWSFWDGSGSI